MKKKYIIWAIVAVVLLAAVIITAVVLINKKNAPFKNKVADSLPGYESAVMYRNSGDAELIKYGKYTYKNVTDEILSKNEYLKKIDLSTLNISDMEALTSATEQFDLMLGTLDDASAESVADITANFDFDLGSIGAPNYFYVETVTGDKTDETPSPETCDKIYIYYFDVEAQTLYYFYVNQKGVTK